VKDPTRLRPHAARLRLWVTRGGLVFADQAVSSLTNGLVGIVAARVSGPEGLGSVARALAVAYLAIALHRAMSGEPMLVFGTSNASGSLAATLAVGAFAAVVTGAAAISLGDGALAALALGLVAVLVQDWGRYAFFASGRPGYALLSDLLWMTVQSIALAAAASMGLLHTWGILAAWGAGGLAGAIPGLALLRPRPRPVGLLRWLRHTKRLSAGATAQVLLSEGAGQVGILAISAVAGLGALGGLRAAQLLLSPASLALTALTPLLLPDLSGNVGPDLRRIRGGAGLASTLGASIVLGYFGVVLLWPQAFTLIFGEPFGVYGALVPFAGLAALAQGVAVGPGLGVRALGEGKAVFLTQAAAVAVGMPVTIVAAARWGAAGAAAGLAAQSAVLCLASWLTYLGALRGLERAC